MIAQARETDIAAAILAGGQARRLGETNKAALDLGDRRIVDRQFDVLRDVATTVFVVGANPGPWIEYGVRVVADEIAGAGALGGIYTAIVASPCERTLVVGCDMPFLSSPFLRHLAGVENADLVIPRSRRGYEPLCAIYARACAPGIRRRIERGALEASLLPDDVRVAEIGADVLAAYDPDDLLFVNVNTPHDYERAKRLLGMQPVPTEDRITTRPATDD